MSSHPEWIDKAVDGLLEKLLVRLKDVAPLDEEEILRDALYGAVHAGRDGHKARVKVALTPRGTPR